MNIFKREINKSKKKAWTELIQQIDKDTWGLLYKLVMGKIKPASVPLTEKMEDGQVKEIIKELFPPDQQRAHVRLEVNWQEEWSVTALEMNVITKRMGNKNKAPGPDGIWKRLIHGTMDIMVERWTKCFQSCIQSGTFPAKWKVSKLVLIKKPDKPDYEPSSYRPICLLNEGGKLLERLISNRINNYLENHEELSIN